MSIDFSEYTFDIANPEKKRKIMTNIERYVREGTNVDEVDWENMPKREDEEPAPKYKSTPKEKKIFISGFA